MITVNLPDGSKAQFPDGTPKDVIKGAIQRKLSSQPAAPSASDQMRAKIADRATRTGGVQGAVDRSAELNTQSMQGIKDPGAVSAFVQGGAQGATMGFADEVLGGVSAAGRAVGDVATGNFSGMGGRIADSYANTRDAVRGGYKDASFARPATTFAGEVGGALVVPIPGAKEVTGLKAAVAAGVKTGAMVGAATGIGRAEGGVVDRLQGGLEGAVAGAIFGAAVPVAVNFGSKAFKAIFTRSAQRPSIESLRAAKTVAYNAVDSAGERFAPADFAPALAQAVKGLDDVNYLPEADTITAGMMRKFEEISQKGVTLGQLDKFRQSLWSRYNTSKEPGLLEVVDAIDTMVSSRAATSDLLDAARMANARYKKAELLDMAFTKAADQTNATGSGGNVLNKMRQAVASIANNPKQAKWFSTEEISTMREFVKGSLPQNTMRLIGKLAPTGNGLMTALNLGAAAVNPQMLAVSALASGAKAISDGATERQGQRLIGLVAGQKPAPAAPMQFPTKINALAGVVGQQF